MTMQSRFPRIHNATRARRAEGMVTFSFFDSLGQGVTRTLPLLTPTEVIRLTEQRLDRFKSQPAGTRESEQSRAERKYVSAQPEAILRAAWEDMGPKLRMEFEMMLDMSSHFGISDPDYVEQHSTKLHAVQGDDGKPL